MCRRRSAVPAQLPHSALCTYSWACRRCSMARASGWGVPCFPLSWSGTRALGAPRAFCQSPGRRGNRYHVLCKGPATQAARVTSAYLCPPGCAMLGSMQHQDMTGGACCMLACPSFHLTCYARRHMLRSPAWGCAQEQPLVADACMETMHSMHQRSAALSLPTTQPCGFMFQAHGHAPMAWVRCVPHEPRHAGGPDGQHVGSFTVNNPPTPRRGSCRQSDARLAFAPGHRGGQCGRWREAEPDTRSAVPARARSCIALVPVAVRGSGGPGKPSGVRSNQLTRLCGWTCACTSAWDVRVLAACSFQCTVSH